MVYNTAIVKGNRGDIQTNIKTVLDTLSIAPGTMPNTIITKTGADNFIAVITYELAAGASTPPIAASPSNIDDGSKDVTTAGSRETLVASSTPCNSVVIQAKTTNTGYIYVGGNTIAAGRGIELSARDSVPIDISDLINIYIDASVNGEGVTYAYVT